MAPKRERDRRKINKHVAQEQWLGLSWHLFSSCAVVGLQCVCVCASTKYRFIYRHSWSEGDLVVCDNRSCVHRGRPWRNPQTKRQISLVKVAEGQVIASRKKSGVANFLRTARSERSCCWASGLRPGSQVSDVSVAALMILM